MPAKCCTRQCVCISVVLLAVFANGVFYLRDKFDLWYQQKLDRLADEQSLEDVLKKFDLWELECAQNIVPKYTHTGVKQTHLSSNLKAKLRQQLFTGAFQREDPEQSKILVSAEKQNPRLCLWNYCINITIGETPEPTFQIQQLRAAAQDLNDELVAEIKGLLEQWTGLENLIYRVTYGPRMYAKGARVHAHLDKHWSHVLSAIINLDQSDSTVSWPLVAWQHDGSRRDFHFNRDEGDVLLYESATLVHGRPYRLPTENYTNVFVHFSPAGHSYVLGLVNHCIAELIESGRFTPDESSHFSGGTGKHSIWDWWSVVWG